MKNLTEFTGQNWLITPAALAVGQQQPANIHDQLWLLVLTGVVKADFKGKSRQWLNETLSFLPDMSGPQLSGTSGPLSRTTDHCHTQKPSAAADAYAILVSLEEWGPFVSLSWVFDQ